MEQVIPISNWALLRKKCTIVKKMKMPTQVTLFIRKTKISAYYMNLIPLFHFRKTPDDQTLH